jgi:hypothetical protein
MYSGPYTNDTLCTSLEYESLQLLAPIPSCPGSNLESNVTYMSVVGAFAAKSIRPPDESIGPGAKVMGSVCEGRPPRT